MAVDLVKGDFDVADDTGSGGPAAISASTYGYQSVNLSDGEVTVEEWVAANPDAKWVVEIYRDGEIIHQLATDSANADGYNQIQHQMALDNMAMESGGRAVIAARRFSGG